MTKSEYRKLKIYHRGTEITEKGVFPWPGDPPASPCSHGGLVTAREKSLRLRRKLFSLAPTADMKPPGYEIVPVGLRSLARSPPARHREPLRRGGRVSRSGKNIVLSVLSMSPWLANKSRYGSLVSTVCGAKGIDYWCRAAICKCSLRFLGPSNSQKNILCQVPSIKRPPDTSTVSAEPTRLVLTWAGELPSMCL